MDKELVYREWRQATTGAVLALAAWLELLEEWERGGEVHLGDLDAALRELSKVGLERWAADNQAGGGVDVLAAVIRGGDVYPP